MTTPRANKRATVRDVAAAAGVSRATVSRVINGARWVSDEARSAVEAAITATEFRVNPHARSLVTKRSDTVVFLLTEAHDRLFQDPVLSVLLRQAAAEIEARELTLVLMFAGSDVERRRVRDYILSGHVDGVLMISYHAGNPLLPDLVDAGIPVVAAGSPLGLQWRISSVAADERAGAMLATQHLIDTGRRRIATIAGPQDTSGGVERLDGYRTASGGTADPSLVAYGDWSEASGAAAMRELIERHPDIDAVFAANDAMALAAVTTLQAHALRVPDDVAVIGFDDADAAAVATPALTTMRQPFARIAREMVRLLIEAIDGAPPAVVTLPTELIVRAST